MTRFNIFNLLLSWVCLASFSVCSSDFPVAVTDLVPNVTLAVNEILSIRWTTENGGNDNTLFSIFVNVNSFLDLEGFYIAENITRRFFDWNVNVTAGDVVDATVYVMGPLVTSTYANGTNYTVHRKYLSSDSQVQRSLGGDARSTKFTVVATLAEATQNYTNGSAAVGSPVHGISIAYLGLMLILTLGGSSFL